jgi:hydrogenase maturation factor
LETVAKIAACDYALVLVGFALTRIDEAESRLFALLAEMDGLKHELGSEIAIKSRK